MDERGTYDDELRGVYERGTVVREPPTDGVVERDGGRMR